MIEKFSTDSIVLERLKLIDSKTIYRAILKSKDEISPWLSWLSSGYDQKACDDFIRLQINLWETEVEYTFAIKSQSNEFLGMISLHVFDPQNCVASIGYWMNTKFSKKGFCTQALKLLVNRTFLPLNLNRIEVVIAVTNIASQKVAINAGAVFESIQQNRIKLHGQAINAQMYCFTSPVL